MTNQEKAFIDYVSKMVKDNSFTQERMRDAFDKTLKDIEKNRENEEKRQRESDQNLKTILEKLTETNKSLNRTLEDSSDDTDKIVEKLKEIKSQDKEVAAQYRKAMLEEASLRRKAFEQEIRDRKDDLQREIISSKATKEFYEYGHKKDRQGGFLQKLFEARKSGKGLFSSLTSATLSTAYEKTLKNSVGSVQKLYTAISGNMTRGGKELFETMMSNDENEKRERKEYYAGRMKKSVEQIKLEEKLFERAREKKLEQLKSEEDSIKKAYTRTGMFGGSNNKETSSEDEAQLEADEQYKEKSLKVTSNSSDYLKEIAAILKQVSDPTTHASFSVRTKLDHLTGVSGAPKKEEAKSGGLLGGLFSTLGVGLLSKLMPTKLISNLLSKVPGAKWLSKIPGIGGMFGGAAEGAASKPGLISRAGSAVWRGTKALASGAGRMVSRGLGTAGRLAGKVALPLTGLLAAKDMWDASKGGFKDAQETFGKKQMQLTTGERISSQIGRAAEGLSFGLLDRKSATKAIHGAGSAIADAPGKGISWLQENIPGLKTAGKFFQKEGLAGGAKKVGSELWSMGKDTAGGAKDYLDKSGITAGASSLWEKGKSLAGDAGSWVKDKASGAVSAVGSALGVTDLLQQLIELVQKLWGSYSQMVKTGMQKAASSAIAYASTLPTGTLDSIQAAATGRNNTVMNTSNQ